ncbi:MAG: ABC transporter permease [Rubrivivax sp.]|nr:ABC transporter permease [Rubrivivax sp.]
MSGTVPSAGPSRVARVAAPVGVALALLALWHGAVLWFEWPPYLVPSPLRVAEVLGQNAAMLGLALANTMQVALLALAAAVLLGTAIAFVFVQSRSVETALFPYAVLLQVTPVVSIAPLVIIWVKDPTASLVICATVVALFPIVANTTLGLRSVDPGLLALFRLQRASRWQLLWRLRVPSALPYFLAGLRISAGLALIGAVVAEFVAGTGGTASGLAYRILMAGYQLDVPLMFAALFLVALAGVALFAATSLLSRWLLGGWHESETRLD